MRAGGPSLETKGSWLSGTLGRCDVPTMSTPAGWGLRQGVCVGLGLSASFSGPVDLSPRPCPGQVRPAHSGRVTHGTQRPWLASSSHPRGPARQTSRPVPAPCAVSAASSLGGQAVTTGTRCSCRAS